MAAQNQSAFYELPQELHLWIFESLRNDAETPKAHCKTLRLVHPRFGHLQKVKIFLFGTIILRPTRERLADVSCLRAVGEYVRHLDIEPVSTGSRATLEQLVSMLALLPPVLSVTLRDCPTGPRHAQIGRYVIMPQALLMADFISQGFSTAGTKLQGLDLRYTAEFVVEISEQESWRNLDLGYRQALSYRPNSDSTVLGGRGEHDQNRRTNDEIIETFTTLLSRCANSLEELSFHDTGPFLFFPESFAVPMFSSLRKIALHAVRVDQPRLGSWLQRCTSLEVAHFVNLKAWSWDQGFAYWRPLFRALRHHPNRMLVVIRYLPYRPGHGCVLSLRHHTGSPAEDTTHLHKRARCLARVWACMKIKNYMSGLGEWITEVEENPLLGEYVQVSDVADDCCDSDRGG